MGNFLKLSWTLTYKHCCGSVYGNPCLASHFDGYQTIATIVIAVTVLRNLLQAMSTPCVLLIRVNRQVTAVPVSARQIQLHSFSSLSKQDTPQV